MQENVVLDLFGGAGLKTEGMSEEQMATMAGRVHDGCFAAMVHTLQNRLIQMGKEILNKEISLEEAQKCISDYREDTKNAFIKDFVAGTFKQELKGTFIDMKKN